MITAVLVSGILFGTGATIIGAAAIMWCILKRREQVKSVTDISLQAVDDAGKSQTIELTSVEYEIPVLREHKDQTIHIQDNVAYGEIISP